MAHAKTFLDNFLVEGRVCEMRGVIKGAEPAFYGNYFIGEGAVFYNDVTIIGPVYIGSDVEIMPGAIIRPYTIISDTCSVGHGSEIKHSVMFPGSKVSSLSFVGDSVLGVSARIGSGVITANRKFDQTEVNFKCNGEKHPLGNDYFGVVLGDSSRLGANCTTQPGTHIGPYSWVFPQICVRDFIPEKTRVMKDEKLVFSENPAVELKP
ncbi:MAG: glucose-1-phosphate thymidylyltransferase [Clostridiales bacterium]|nr:glucose-1-phosphate thymidylyltransferase [Clostridiales bacterium]